MNSLEGRRCLVTGADGFIGSHLVERLVADGATVRALCSYNSMGSRGWLEESETVDHVEIALGDVRDHDQMDTLCRDVDVVFHLAALIAIPFSYEAPSSYVETNIRGTQNVLSSAARSGARVVHTSTSEVYGTPDEVPIRESHPIRPQSPYAATKAAADHLCNAWACSFDVDVVVLRPFNTYGPRQSARAVIPVVLGQMLAGSPTIALGSLTPQRDFTYVSDTVDGFIRMAATPAITRGSVIHLGTGHTVSIGDLVQICREVTGSDAVVVTDDERIRPEASEVDVLLSDPARAFEEIGWTPTVGLRTGLERTASWLEKRVNPATVGRYQR